MKRTTLTFLAAATLLAAACSAPMPRGNWSEAPYKALCKLMKDCKKESAGAEYNMNYAVFDYDNTTVMQDVELAVMGWQLENLRLRFTPEEVWGLFAPQIPDLDTVLTGAGAEGISARMLIKDIESDYRAITSAAGVRCGEEITEEQLAEARKTPEYEDFRAKLMALYEGTYETFDYREGLMIIVALFHNMTTTEMSALVKQAVPVAFHPAGLPQISSPSGRIFPGPAGIGVINCSPEIRGPWCGYLHNRRCFRLWLSSQLILSLRRKACSIEGENIPCFRKKQPVHDRLPDIVRLFFHRRDLGTSSAQQKRKGGDAGSPRKNTQSRCFLIPGNQNQCQHCCQGRKHPGQQVLPF